MHRARLVAVALAFVARLNAADPPSDLIAIQAGTLPIIVSAPHGGEKPVPGSPKRKGEGMTKGSTGFFAGRDPGTEQLAHAIAERIEKKLGAKPHFVIAQFHREYVDPNRNVTLAVESEPAKKVYEQYHAALAKACEAVQKSHGRGLLIDVHGQGSSAVTIFRGTKNGLTCSLLRQRFGESAHSGPEGFFGLLTKAGATVSPTTAEGKETNGFTGGYIVQTYGSHTGYGIDAIQLEFGADYRATEEKRAAAADKVVEAVVGYAKRYLPLPVAEAPRRGFNLFVQDHKKRYYCIPGAPPPPLVNDAIQAQVLTLGTVKAVSAERTTIAVDRVLKPHPLLGDRKMIELNRVIPFDPNQPRQFIIFGDEDKGQIDWYRGTPGSHAFAEYLAARMALPPAERSKVLRFAYDHLLTEDTATNEEAQRELIASHDVDLLALARTLAPKPLRQARPSPLIAYLLAGCGTRDDAEPLRAYLRNDEQRYLAPYWVAIALLDPERGWGEIAKTLATPQAPLRQRYNALQVARYFIANPHPAISEAAVTESVKALLDQDDMADLAVEALSDWHVWQYSDRVLSLQRSNQEHLRQAVLRYALLCPDPQCREFVAAERTRDPERIAGLESSLKH